MSQTRNRVGYKFWLDSSNILDAALMKEIHLLKTQRRFTSTLRDGIRLMQSLRQGKTDVLKELFPWVFEHIDHDDSIDRVLREELVHIRKLLAHQSAAPVSDLPNFCPTSEIIDNSVELEIKTAKSNENPSYNLQLSGVGIGAIKLHDLSSDCLQYGLDMNKFNPSAVKQVRALLKSRGVTTKPEPTAKAPDQSGGPKKMKVPDIAPPVLDDDLDDDLLVVSTGAV